MRGCGRWPHLYPDRRALATVVRRLFEHDYPIDDVLADGGALSVYVSDPDGNEIALYYDLTSEPSCAEPQRVVTTSQSYDVRALLLQSSSRPVELEVSVG
jgi:catechol-2,3-dioxygenase